MTNNSLAFQNTTTTLTGLSDCHKLVLTVLKTTFSKNKPKELFYRDYKKFNFSDFNDELKTIFSRNTVGLCYQFDQIFLNVLDKHAPMKRKLLRANHSCYISKPLRKAITRRSHLENVYYKNKSEESFKAYKKQKNFAADSIKKKENGFSIILIRLLFLTINYSGKRLNHSFQTRKITDHKLNSLKKMRYCKKMIRLEGTK